jgi:hypothetical protein
VKLWTEKRAVAALMGVSLAVAAGGAQAQSIFGFKVGDDLRADAKTHTRPSVEGSIGSYAALKWSLANGNAVSVTVSPQTRRIVFVESDWGGDAAAAATEVPGLTFGTTRLADIRQKFQSNGFGFKGNLGSLIGHDLVAFNCYQIKGSADLVVVFVTALPVADVPVVDGQPKPDTGQAHLVGVILASQDYLKTLWGPDRVFDARNHPIEWK